MKAGDRITIINDRYGTGGNNGKYFRVGDTGVIVEAQDSQPWQVILKLDRTGDTVYAAPSALKVVTPHPHAALMAQYAEDATQTEQPWLLWEFQSEETARWKSLLTHPGWSRGVQYRRRPEAPPTRVINGFTVPAPETVALAKNTRYYLVAPTLLAWWCPNLWHDQRLDHLYLERGLVFLAEEHAVANAKAMVGIDPEWRQP